MEKQSLQVELDGGNMSRPRLEDGRVYKDATGNSQTIHRLLQHYRSMGLDWVPESYGVDDSGRHVLSYLPGDVPQETPAWLWAEEILMDAARKLRELHDASAGFSCPDDVPWQLPPREPAEVVCHNDFAPYNCVFSDGGIRGVIDFDLSSPGPRIWDIAYTAYRFIPLYPVAADAGRYEASPFSAEEMYERLLLFLKEYGLDFDHRQDAVLRTARERLTVLARWTDRFAAESGRGELQGHATLYRYHAKWLPI